MIFFFSYCILHALLRSSSTIYFIMAKNINTQRRSVLTTGNQGIQPAQVKTKAETAPRRNLYYILAALIITFIAFVPTFQNEFVNWDDPINIYENPHIVGFTWENIKDIFTHNIIGNYNPLPIFTFAIERAVFGVTNLATVIHTDNLLLHLVSVFLVFQLCLKMGTSRWAAFLIALLFGIHPMRVESVAWATERKDVLFGVFYFATLIYYIRYLNSDVRGTNDEVRSTRDEVRGTKDEVRSTRDEVRGTKDEGRSTRYEVRDVKDGGQGLKQSGYNKKLLIPVFVLFAFAIFSKVQSVALPLSMVALDYYFKRPLRWDLLLEKWAFFLGSLIFGVVTVILLKEAKTINDSVTNFNLFDRSLIACYSYVVYCVKFIYPWLMSPLYTYPAKIEGSEFILAPIAVLGTLWLVWKAYTQKWYAVVFGIAFFWFNFVFVSQIVGAGQGYLADRFTYIPYFGFFFLGVVLVERWAKAVPGRKMMVNIGLAAYLLLFASMTYNQIPIWKNGGTLWTAALNYEPNLQTSLPYGNRGIYYRDNKQFAEAKMDLLTAIQYKAGAGTFNSLGKLYFDMKPPKLDSAIFFYNKGLLKDSTIAEIWTNRGSAYGMAGNLEASVSDLTHALRIDSVNQNALMNRSLAYQSLKRFDLALVDDDLFLRLKNDNPDMWYDRALVKRNLKMNKESLTDFDEAIRLQPDNPIYLLERGKCYYELGDRVAGKRDAEGAEKRGLKLSEGDRLLMQ